MSGRKDLPEPAARKLEWKGVALFVARIGMTILALYTLFWLYHPSDVLKHVSDVGPVAFCGAALLYALCIAIGASKWKLLLPGVPFARLLHAVTASCFYSILPSGQLGGELSKVLIVKSRHPDVRGVFASVVFDKITGVLGLLLIGLFALTFSGSAVVAWQLLLLLVLATGCGVVLLAAHPLAAFIQKIRIRHRPLHAGRAALVDALSSIGHYARNRLLLARSVGMGILSQGTIIIIYLVIARALHIPATSADLVAAVTLANLAALLPISVAGFGIREAGLTTLLTQGSGVGGAQALALSLTVMSIFLIAALAGALTEAKRILHVRRA